VRDNPTVDGEMMEMVDSTASLVERADSSLRWLGRFLTFDAAWLAVSDPQSSLYSVVGSLGLSQTIVDYLDRPQTARDIERVGLHLDRPPMSVADLAFPVEDLPTWVDCLSPAGFREGLGVALYDGEGLHVGFLGLLYNSQDEPSIATRARLVNLAPLIARGLSPMRSLLASTRIVSGVEAGVVLLHDGSTWSLPGLRRDAVLQSGSPVVQIANSSLAAGHVYRSFLWPAHATGSNSEHLRLTVLAASELSFLVRGMLLVTPDAECRGLTPRELQVLGLLVDGRSNQEMARTLAVAQRTIATHVEHVMRKLEAPSRTLAAVLAEREGCYVPPSPRVIGGGRH
jgi:DNA-binding CsgD family transcriptional regulator